MLNLFIVNLAYDPRIPDFNLWLNRYVQMPRRLTRFIADAAAQGWARSSQ